MAYYYVLIAYYLFGYLFLKKNTNIKTRKRYVFFALLPAFILVAFRSVSVGNDTYMYYYAFQKYKAYNNISGLLDSSIREPGFLFLNYLCIKLGLSYYSLQIAISWFIFYSLYRYISKYSEDAWLSCLLFLLNRHMFGTMNTMRMWLAIAVVLFAVPYVIKRKIIPFVVLTIIAMSFHFTAIVFLIVYSLARIKWNTKNIIFSIGVAAVISMFGRSFFSFVTRLINRYNGYLDGGYFDSGGTATYIGLIIQICFFLYVFIEYKKWNYHEDAGYEYEKIGAARTYYEGYLLSSMLVVLLLDIIGLNNTIMSRISAFFSPAMYLAIPYSLRTTERKNRRILAFVIILLLVLNFIIVMKYRPGWYGVTEYKFMWQDIY